MGDINTNSSDSLTETIGGTRVAKREVDTEYVFKIVVLGDYNVGKTTLIHRLLHTSLPSKHTHKHENKDKTMKTHNKWKGKVNVAQEESSDESDKDDNDIAEMDMEHISPTIGVEFFAKFIPHIHPHINVRLQFWDTAELTRYATLDNHVYRHASLILCVFDVTQKDSLEHIVSQHLVHAAEYIPELEQDKIIVVGNKLDLLHDNVNAFTELLNNYHRHRRPDAAFLTSPIASSFHRSNDIAKSKNNNIASVNKNADNNKQPKSNAITTNEGTNTDAINDAIVNNYHDNNDLLYSSSDDNTSIDETTNTNTSNKNIINRTTHDNITKQQRRQARWEAEAHNSVITEKDVYECLLNDFDDIKYLTVSARSNINMSRLLELMCDVLLCKVTDAHYEKNRDESVHEHEEHENVPVKEMEECVNKEYNNTNGNTREEICSSRASDNGTYEIEDYNKEHVDLQPSSMPINIPVVALQECDRTPHYNSYNVGCWSNNTNTLSFNLSPQEQTATFVESEDNLYSPQEGKDMSMAPQDQMQPTQCEHNYSSNENNNTSMSVTISATQLIESTLQSPENVKIANVLDTHEKMDKEINCNIVKQQIVHTDINQNNIRVAEDKEEGEEEATCLHQENAINTFTNYTRDNAQLIQKAQLLQSYQEPVEMNLLEEQQDEKEIIRPRASLLDQVAHEYEQQRQQANTTSNNGNNDECNDEGMNLEEELRDRFAAIEAESRQRCEANKTKHCKDNNNNNSSTLAHNTIDTTHNNSSPVMNVAQRYKKDKKHICQCGSLPCTCM